MIVRICYKITSIIKQPKGSVINLRELYRLANYCKIDLMDVKKTLPPLKQSFWDKFTGNRTELYRYNNLLLPEIGDIDRFIRSLDDLLKQKKIM